MLSLTLYMDDELNNNNGYHGFGGQTRSREDVNMIGWMRKMVMSPGLI